MRPISMAAAALSVLALSSLTVGCSSEAGEDEATEDALERGGAKVLFRGVAYPSGLTVTDNHVYFGSNKFVASGDAELDQQFAYWTGKFSRVALGGGRAETVSDNGPINRVRMSGRKMFYTTGTCWIGVYDTSTRVGGDMKTVYQLDGCEPDSGPTLAGFEVTSDRVFAVHTDGKVVSVKHNGEDKKQVAELRIGDWGDLVRDAIMADGKIIMLTATHLTDSRGRAVPQAFHAVDVETGRLSKVTDLAKEPSNLATDGKNLFFSQEKNKLMVLKSGASEPKLVSEEYREIIDIAAADGNAYVADSERDAVYEIRDAAGSPQAHKKLGDVKGVRSIAVSGTTLVYGSHVVSGRRAAGVIGTLPIPR